MKKTTSPYIIVRKSNIHSTGVFAKKDIAKRTHVIEYVGERITKQEAERRAEIPRSKAKKDSRYGAVYIFELNTRHDIDGNVWYNTARFINHSCNPNCEPVIMRGHIWIIAVRHIDKGEEITYNYGYGFEDYHEHPCRCGSSKCVGYILDRKHWWRLRKHQEKLFLQGKKVPGVE